MMSRPGRFVSTVPTRLKKTGFAPVLICALVVAAAQFGAAQSFSNLYQFSLQSGWQPWAGVTRDAAGNLYGTTTGSSYDPERSIS